ncbi:MAG TPA: hypothetical protein VKG02_06735, partial [Blastocatellia bacterium]|nr:hypothetical protein [Blastocatellia bacterium]
KRGAESALFGSGVTHRAATAMRALLRYLFRDHQPDEDFEALSFKYAFGFHPDRLLRFSLFRRRARAGSEYG